MTSSTSTSPQRTSAVACSRVRPAHPSTPRSRLEIARAEEAVARYCWSPYMHDPGLRHRLRRITAPTLVVSGTNDRFVLRPDYYETYARLIGEGATLRKIDGAGHNVEEEMPDAVVALVNEFVAPRAGRPLSKETHVPDVLLLRDAVSLHADSRVRRSGPDHHADAVVRPRRRPRRVPQVLRPGPCGRRHRSRRDVQRAPRDHEQHGRGHAAVDGHRRAAKRATPAFWPWATRWPTGRTRSVWPRRWP